VSDQGWGVAGEEAKWGDGGEGGGQTSWELKAGWGRRRSIWVREKDRWEA
jgi:hypothetical protein